MITQSGVFGDVIVHARLFEWTAHLAGEPGPARRLGVSDSAVEAMGALSQAIMGCEGWGDVVEVVHLSGDAGYQPLRRVAYAEARNGLVRWVPAVLVALREQFDGWLIDQDAIGRWRAREADGSAEYFANELGMLTDMLTAHATPKATA